ncbi:rod shape-determining protein MreD [Candidatus Aerophobetes bacterium]|nr:rod shape-determining protein MreD [Candidatus Aerophobetes bacterium]
MKKLLLFLALFFLSLILQFVLTGWIGKRSADLFLILTILWSYHRGWKEGILAGFFCGLGKDIFFFPLIGINAFSLSLIALLTSEVKIRIYQQNVLFFALMAGILILINTLILSIYLFLFYRFPFLYTIKSSLYPSFFSTWIISCIIYLSVENLTRKFIPQS